MTNLPHLKWPGWPAAGALAAEGVDRLSSLKSRKFPHSRGSYPPPSVTRPGKSEPSGLGESPQALSHDASRLIRTVTNLLQSSHQRNPGTRPRQATPTKAYRLSSRIAPNCCFSQYACILKVARPLPGAFPTNNIELILGISIGFPAESICAASRCCFSQYACILKSFGHSFRHFSWIWLPGGAF